MAFFTDQSAAWLKGLSANNNKAWFDAHRKEYEQHFKKPYQALAAALVEQVAELEPEYQIPAKYATYRINRDVRFAKDKTPYKTELGITVGRSARHDWAWPAYTCRIGLAGVWVAGGMYQPSTELRDHLRRYVGEHSARLRDLMNAEPYRSTFGDLQGEAHKRAPAELKDLAAAEPLVLNKQWVFWRSFDDPSLFTSETLDQFILDQWEIARPVQEFLKDAVRAYNA
ncbi:MAG: DUF2461 domain-containing protein [Acidimicrobiales bacterium]|nr:DUF2461 domain-containing protein [Acidimicrobiales bacterium]